MRQIAGNDTKPYVLVLHAHSESAPRCERHVGGGGLVGHRHLDGLAEDAVFQEELLSERLHLVAHDAVVVVARLRVSLAGVCIHTMAFPAYQFRHAKHTIVPNIVAPTAPDGRHGCHAWLPCAPCPTT